MDIVIFGVFSARVKRRLVSLASLHFHQNFVGSGYPTMKKKPKPGIYKHFEGSPPLQAWKPRNSGRSAKECLSDVRGKSRESFDAERAHLNTAMC